jgi:nucleoside-diphosphate-sugar epimerase
LADVSKARRLLGYEPEVTVEEGLKRTWDWFNTYSSLK